MPYPGGGALHTGSSRAINSPGRQPSSAEEANSGSAGTSYQRRGNRHCQPLDQHLNKPLRLVPWTSRNRRWTRSLLDREREAFFHTRVTGRQEIWQTIQAALEVLQAAPDTVSRQQESIAAAQTILDAAEITLPSGNLANGVYDALGNYYSLPEYVVSDPTDLVHDPVDHGQHGKQVNSINGASQVEDDNEGEELSRRREEKGKAIVNFSGQISVKARLSENAQDIEVNIGERDTAKILARKILVQSGVSICSFHVYKLLAVAACSQPFSALPK